MAIDSSKEYHFDISIHREYLKIELINFYLKNLSLDRGFKFDFGLKISTSIDLMIIGSIKIEQKEELLKLFKRVYDKAVEDRTKIGLNKEVANISNFVKNILSDFMKEDKIALNISFKKGYFLSELSHLYWNSFFKTPLDNRYIFSLYFMPYLSSGQNLKDESIDISIPHIDITNAEKFINIIERVREKSSNDLSKYDLLSLSIWRLQRLGQILFHSKKLKRFMSELVDEFLE